MFQKIRFEYEPGKFDERITSNLSELYVDADHASDVKTRKSVSCILAAIVGVIVHRRMGKQSCIAVNSTDAEVRAYFMGTQLNKLYE